MGYTRTVAWPPIVDPVLKGWWGVEDHSPVGVSALCVQGDLDHAAAPALRPVLRGRLDDEGYALLDLRSCAYIDSGGLGMLLALAAEMAPDAWMGVIGPNRNIRRLFELAGLQDYASFKIFADEAEAEAYLQSWSAHQ